MFEALGPEAKHEELKTEKQADFLMRFIETVFANEKEISWWETSCRIEISLLACKAYPVQRQPQPGMV